MSMPTIGRCENCNTIASIKERDDEYLCPDCRFYAKHPQERGRL